MAKPDMEKVLSDGQRYQLPGVRSDNVKYQLYFSNVRYDFVFHVAADSSVDNGGVIMREFVQGEGSTISLSPEEQRIILQTIAEKRYPDWMIQAARQRLFASEGRRPPYDFGGTTLKWFVAETAKLSATQGSHGHYPAF
jgi:hypothetical protein